MVQISQPPNLFSVGPAILTCQVTGKVVDREKITLTTQLGALVRLIKHVMGTKKTSQEI